MGVWADRQAPRPAGTLANSEITSVDDSQWQWQWQWHECPMVVLGTDHHVVVLCRPSSRKLHPGQRLIDSNKRSAMPMGVHARFMWLHLAWLQALDGTSFWCSKCGDRGGLDDDDMPLVCDSEGCGPAHHMSCSSLEPKRLDFWRCDMCVITERVVQRTQEEALNLKAEPDRCWGY